MWTTDITYIATDEGWLYLTVLLDLHSRQVVGWSMKEHMQASLVVDALRMAYFRRKPQPGLIVHSDRRSQYCGHDFQNALKSYGMKASMSRRATVGITPLPRAYGDTCRWHACMTDDLPPTERPLTKSLTGWVFTTTRDCIKRWAMSVQWCLNYVGTRPSSRTGKPHNRAAKEPGKQGQPHSVLSQLQLAWLSPLNGPFQQRGTAVNAVRELAVWQRREQ